MFGFFKTKKKPIVEDQLIIRRKKTVEKRIDDVIMVLEECKLDIAYMNKLKKPLDEFEIRYFNDQLNKINGAIAVLNWVKIKFSLKKHFWSFR